MLKRFSVIPIVAALCLPALAIEQRHGMLVGAVLRLDTASRTVAVKLADGTVHTFHFTERTAVHGVKDTAAGAADVFHGLRVGTQVAVHYTARGTTATALEIDNIGKDGLKSTDATVVRIDRGARMLAVKTADGAEETYHLTGSAAQDAGKDIGAGSEKSARVTIYYTEEAGHKVAHFFKRAI